MTFTVYGEVKIQAKSSKAEINRIRKELEALRKGAFGAAGGVGGLGAKEEEAANQARDFGDANRVAAGQLGNLMAQFNDIGVMLMAGQNPLQLAVQQGTQITQVIGPMGAQGAVKALGGAFMGMLNPISLVTIGGIAAGASIIGWLTGASEKAETLEDKIDATADALQGYSKKADLARLSTVGMFAEFGTADPVLRAVLEDMAALGRVDAYAAIDRTADSVRDLVLDLAFWDERSSVSAAQDFLGLNSIGPAARKAGDEFARNLKLLSQSEEPAFKLKTALDLKGQLLETAGGLENLNEQQRSFYNGLAATIRDLILLGAKVTGNTPNLAAAGQMETILNQELAVRRAIALHGQKSAEVENLRIAQAREAMVLEVDALNLDKQRTAELKAKWDANNPTRNPHLDTIQAARAALAISEKQEAAGQRLLNQITEENTLRWLTVQHGEDSAEVTSSREAAERRAFEETLKTMGASEALKEELLAAFQNGQLLAGLDIASGINSAAQAAQNLADRLGLSLDIAREVVAASGDVGGVGGDPTISGFAENDPRNGKPGVWTGGYSRSTWRQDDGRTRRSGAATDRQADALERLMTQQRLQIDILRATDPVAREMIRNRDLLTGATEAERAALQDLISIRLDEKDALAQATGTHDLFVDVAYDGIRGLISQGDDYADVLENLGLKIADVALEAALLGTGPLSGLFGTSDGGLLGTIATALIPAAATGGYLTGPGDGTSDDILMWGSSGEYMVNARATAKHRPLLEAINSGASIPGFAAGGAIDMPSGSVSAGASQSGLATIIHIENHGSAAITGSAEQSVDNSGRRRMRLVLADQVGDAMTTAGGGAKRALRNRFGVKPTGSRR
jgi:Prophage tail length tape measure protein